MDRSTRLSRRRLLRGLGASPAVALAGCLGGPSGDEPTDPVPKPYRTATAQGGTARNPDALRSKGGVNYHAAQGTATCANCIHYVPDKNGDDLGACAVVEGDIEPDAWCTLYARYDGG
ncbi:high-potential iron-sulfur protein [Haladaptatus sp. T7]|uniref:high-potential iron-sulfur protein n=1 Tax=Haladaptatus sp. T7 TaxID=2029368 RepID=UPI0021A2540E|nr:high-potential iron-sulfur protein [Haladaptatus sp. T7]GKZ16407.1 hypothetical protein HAL_42880 [Haladaptatus sp. T7]